MKSWSPRGFHSWSTNFPRRLRNFVDASAQLLTLLKKIEICDAEAIDVIARTNALYQIAWTVASAEALRTAEVGQLKEVETTPATKALYAGSELKLRGTRCE